MTTNATTPNHNKNRGRPEITERVPEDEGEVVVLLALLAQLGERLVATIGPIEQLPDPLKDLRVVARRKVARTSHRRGRRRDERLLLLLLGRTLEDGGWLEDVRGRRRRRGPEGGVGGCGRGGGGGQRGGLVHRSLAEAGGGAGGGEGRGDDDDGDVDRFSSLAWTRGDNT